MIKETKKKLLTLRITDEQYRMFRFATKSYGLTPSKALRQFIDTNNNAVALMLKQGKIKDEDLDL